MNVTITGDIQMRTFITTKSLAESWLSIAPAFLLCLTGCGAVGITTDWGGAMDASADAGSRADVGADPHVTGAACKNCHSDEHLHWKSTLHAAAPDAVLLNTEHDTAELLTDECIGCHSPFQAATYHIGDFVQPIDQTGPWQLVTANASKWEAIKCEVCHDPTGTAAHKIAFYDGSGQKYVAVKDTTELCEKCHQAGTDDSRDLKGSVHEGKQCAECHLAAGSKMALDPHKSCVNCHPAVNPNHPDVTTLDTTYKSADSPNNIHFVTCKTCHDPTPGP